MTRSIKEDLFLGAVRRALRDALEEEGAGDSPRFTEAVIERVVERVRDYLERQDRAPDLVGPVAAAKILGVQPPHLARLRRQERMPDMIPVEGTTGVYVRQEVEALAEVLAGEREARAERQRAKEESDAAA